MAIGSRSFSSLFPETIDAANYIDENQSAVIRDRTQEGILGWVFDIPTGERIENSSDITDHFTEDNSFINDHVVQKPRRVTLSGYIGELVFKLSEASIQSSRFGANLGTGPPQSFQELSNLLEQVEVYAGDFTPGMVQTAQKALNLADLYQSTLNQQLAKAKNLVGAIDGTVGIPLLPPIPGADGLESTDRQRKAYLKLEALRRSNQIVTVQTPWYHFDSMIIESISISQDENTQTWSELRISLKEVRFAEVKTTEFDKKLQPPRNEIQSGDTVDAGRVQTVPTTIRKSTLYRGIVEGVLKKE